MNRRGFLHGGAASLALAQGSPTSRVALIVEPGGDHLPQHLRAGLCEGIDEFAIADETGQTFELARQALGNRTFRAYRDPVRMTAEFSPKLVVVSMEPRNMPAAIEVALSGGAHVVAEKPGCTALAQFEKLAKLAKAGKRELMLAMASRLYPGAVRARQLIEAGWIGRGYGVDMH